MMYIKTLLLLLFTIQLCATELQRNYFIKGDEILLSDILINIDPKNDQMLFRLSEARHIKRLKSSTLIKLLKKQGYKEITSKYPYIQFSKISPIDTQKIKNQIKEHYEKLYKNIDIQSITVHPRSYMDAMPNSYTVEIRSKEHLENRGVVAIKTDTNKKIFFNYKITAYVNVYLLKNDLQRNGELSTLNTAKNSIILEKFRSMPLQEIQNNSYEVKHKMEKGSLLTQRDVRPLTLIKRDAYVNVSLQNGTIFITFSAKALQSGRKGDTIFVENDKGKKIKVIVTGKNKASVK